jgi:hypothetical protein
MEDRHKICFIEMKAKLIKTDKSPIIFDPEEELSLYLSAMGGGGAYGGEGDPGTADSFTGKKTMEEIVSTAIDLEKQSILFYAGLKGMVPPGPNCDKVEQIIRKEQNHIAQLNGFLKKAAS